MPDIHKIRTDDRPRTPALAFQRRFALSRLCVVLATTIALAIALRVSVMCYVAWDSQTRPGGVHDRRAAVYLHERLNAKAESEWLLGVREDPTYAPNYLHLGNYYLAQQRPRQAALSYTAATQLLPEEGSLWLHLARARREEQDIPGAAAAALRATILLPADAEAFTVYGELMEAQQNSVVAVSILRHARLLAPEDRNAALDLARVEISGHEMEHAERDFLPYLRSHLQDAEACYLLAAFYNEQPSTRENLTQGLMYAQRARLQSPENPYAAILLAHLEMESKRPADAVSDYQAALRISPHSSRALQGLAQCYAQLGEIRQAAKVSSVLREVNARHARMHFLKGALSANPNDADALLEIARLEEVEGDGLAEGYYSQAVRVAPRAPKPRAALAAFYRKTGRIDAAIRTESPDFQP